MKIIHLIAALPVGGAENMLIDILNQQSKLIDVELMIINDIIDSTLIGRLNDKVRVHYLNRQTHSKNIYPLIKLNIKLLFSKADVIHCHNDRIIELIPLHRFHLLHFKIVLTAHNTRLPCNNMHKYDYVFAISKSVKKDIEDRCKVRSHLIYNGIPVNEIYTNKNNLLSNTRPFKILQIGRLLHSQKGQDILIKAIHHLVYQSGITNIVVAFIGDGASKDFLIGLSKSLKIIDHCIWLGEKDRNFIYTHLSEYDLLVQPSQFEGFGLTVVEAMVAKVPVLVADIEGPTEIIQGNKYGHVFRCGDHIDLAIQISTLIKEYNTPSFQQISTQARQHALDNFDIATTSNNYITALTKVTGIE